ncbi:DUF4880 domain-containing protein [Pseudomonas sp. zfem002]|uniref:DUF4880 domain-containing protein n=1 Tax=Pseudomonas sp. zfem002 TaxID=3078197 RepID=UPI00292A2263|nr:DUF4880 domain-containing protein [Pseudomonas sp. zfem002]MDU9390559.1 DUF4880 domain-containing protein [Pseudomonas sp. zfem002]
MSTEQDHLIEQATRWIVLLRSGHASEAERQAFLAWRARDPRHEALCKRLEGTLGVFQVPIAQGVDGALLQRALEAPASRRKVLQRALLGAGLMIGGGWALSPSLQALNADIATGVAQRQRVRLDDGSELLLNARSAVDVRFDGQRRLLEWRGGEGLIRVVGDPRPFIVRTSGGDLCARAAQVLLHDRGEQCRVGALDAPLQIVTRGGDRLQLQAGQEVSYDRYRFGPLHAVRSGDSAWVNGLLEVRDSPLSEVIEALRPYRHGILRLDPAIAGLRVSGLYRLDQSDVVLEALSRTLPIRVNRHSAYWVTLVPA